MEIEQLIELGIQLRDYSAQFHPLFSRPEPRATFEGVLLGMLTAQGRKNSWQLTASMGLSSPDSVQRFFSTTQWDHDHALELYQTMLLDHFGPRGALLFDETGFLKKGDSSVGVQRQYTGTSGKIDNCQVGVFAAWVTPQAHVLWDRRLFFPASWDTDAERRTRAHVPEEVTHISKSKLARDMLEVALARGARPVWVGGDTIYGDDTSLRDAVASHGLEYAFAVSHTTQVWLEWPHVLTPAQLNESSTKRGRPFAKAHLAPGTPARIALSTLVQGWEESRWEERSAGAGSKGERLYQWGFEQVVEASGKLPSRSVLLVVRRSLSDPEDKAYYLCHSHQELSHAQGVERVGGRWPVEQCFKEAKGECGLDQYEVRSWQGWHRHITMSMMAHGFLALQRARWEEQKKQK